MKKFRLIVQKLFLLALVLLSTQGVFAKDDVIEKLEFRKSKLNEVVRFLSDYTGMNIVTTPDAAEIPIDVYLQNVTVKQAIEMIAKSNGLWYREEPDNNAFRLMTTEEYQDDLVVYRDDVTKIFDLLNANVIDMAQMIKSVYGSRVRVALGRQPGDVFQANTGGQGGQGGQAGQRGSSNNNNSPFNGGASNGLQGGSQNGNQALFNAQPKERLNKVNEELSGAFLEQIDQQRSSQQTNQVSASALNSIGAQEAPISVSVNNEHNLLVVRTSDRQALAEIEALVNAMNKPVPQVLLEMKIIDVSIGDDFRSIFDLQADFGTSDVLNTNNTFEPSNQIGLGNLSPQGGSFIYRFLDDSLNITLELLREQNRVNVLATPVLLAANHRQAELFIGTETVITTGFNTSTSDLEGVSRTFITTQTDVREIGNRIALTPRINSNQTVTLQLEQETSSVNVGGGQLFVATDNQVVPLSIDTVNTAQIEGTFMVENGKTVAVGGLIRETKSKATSKVPILGDIPGLKWLFRKETQGEDRSEFVLLITPHIIYHSSEAERITREKIIDKSHYSQWPTEQVTSFAIKPTQEPPQSLDDALGLNQGFTTSVLSDTIKLDSGRITSEQQKIIDLLKFANAQNNGQKVSLSGAEAHSLNKKKRVKIFSNRKLKATPVSSFFYQGLYVTSLTVKTSSKKLIEISAEQVKGDWLSMSMTNSVVVANQPVSLFLVSDRPFEKALSVTMQTGRQTQLAQQQSEFDKKRIAATREEAIRQEQQLALVQQQSQRLAVLQEQEAKAKQILKQQQADRLAKQQSAETKQALVDQKHVTQEAQAKGLVSGWAQAWSDQNVSAYVARYTDNYKPAGGNLSHTAWLDQRQIRLTNKSFINVTVSNFKVRKEQASNSMQRFSVTFSQDYESNTMDDTILKRLTFAVGGSDWSNAKIIAERVIR